MKSKYLNHTSRLRYAILLPWGVQSGAAERVPCYGSAPEGLLPSLALTELCQGRQISPSQTSCREQAGLAYFNGLLYCPPW